VTHGPLINLLTDAGHCDPITATPYHKYVPVRLLANDEVTAGSDIETAH